MMTSSVFALLLLAHLAGAACVLVWGMPGPAPEVLDLRLAVPFLFGLALAIVGALCASRLAPRSTRSPSSVAGSDEGSPPPALDDHPVGAGPSVAWVVVTHAALATSAVLAVSGLFSVVTRTGLVPDGWSSDARTGSVVILAVNDIYRIEGLEGGSVGGLARLRTLRKQLEQAYPGRVLLLHGGDVIFPSFLSRTYGGRQMIDVLNLMDGDSRAGRLDERMFVTLGNHEFEKEGCRSDPVLQQRLAEADFYWLHTNVSYVPCPDRRPRLAGVNLVQGRIVPVGGLRVGLFGLTIETTSDAFRFTGARETARAVVQDLRRRGADVIVAVTHLNWHDDVELFKELRSEGLGLIIGGHDHVSMKLPKDAAEPRIFKADADARTAWVVTLTVHGDARVQATGRLHTLDASVAKDAAVDRQVAGWLKRHAEEFCQAAAADPAWLGARPVTASCLDERLAIAQTRLNASEAKIRSGETSLGNWIADQIVDTFKDCRVDGAFINAGGLRLNQDLATDSPIQMRHLQELVQYPSALRVYKLSHAQLRRALENAVSVPDAGRWLQVSDQIAFTYRPAGDGGPAKLLKAVLRHANKPVIEVTDTSRGDVRIVANEFLQKDPTDGFDKILPPPDDTGCAASGTDLKTILYAAFKAQGRIKADEPGRICTDVEARGRTCRANQPGTPS
jgi:5'-nucleotidase / UDP-sugar diphosphatase